jgi:hypothetical protein
MRNLPNVFAVFVLTFHALPEILAQGPLSGDHNVSSPLSPPATKDVAAYRKNKLDED